MQHRVLSRLVVAGIFGTLVTATAVATAAGPRRPTSEDRVLPDYAKVLDKQLVSTSVQGDSTRYSLAAGFTDIGTPIKFKCTKTCTIMVHAMVQVEELSPYWAICPVVDDIDAIDGCNWQGATSTTSSVYVTGSGTYFWSLAAGTHTFQPQVYLSVAGGLDNWAMTIGLYQ